jgi:hypothetical protein
MYAAQHATEDATSAANSGVPPGSASSAQQPQASVHCSSKQPLPLDPACFNPCSPACQSSSSDPAAAVLFCTLPCCRFHGTGCCILLPGCNAMPQKHAAMMLCSCKNLHAQRQMYQRQQA